MGTLCTLYVSLFCACSIWPPFSSLMFLEGMFNGFLGHPVVQCVDQPIPKLSKVTCVNGHLPLCCWVFLLFFSTAESAYVLNCIPSWIQVRLWFHHVLPYFRMYTVKYIMPLYLLLRTSRRKCFFQVFSSTLDEVEIRNAQNASVAQWKRSREFEKA